MNQHHTDLIDTTEMYLRTVYEMEEEGITPLRARIAERLGQSGPTVSQTVARMERDGLMHVASDRHLELSPEGRRRATAVMRKHRLAERLLLDVLGMEWDQLHIEACRWEHVISDAVERRIIALLDNPLVCPHGNPIPGLDELKLSADGSDYTPCITSPQLDASPVTLLDAGIGEGMESVRIERISEQLQPDEVLMRELIRADVLPGHTVAVRSCADGVEVDAHDGRIVLDHFTAEHIFIRRLSVV